MAIARRSAVKRKRPLWQRRPAKAAASNSSVLAFAKGPTRAEEKAARDAHEREVIAQVRAQVFASCQRCVCCGMTERESIVRFGAAAGAHAMHEAYPRSLTRGRPPEHRFDVRWCMRLCGDCHRKIHAAQLVPIFDSRTLGALGMVRFLHKGEPMRSGWWSAFEVWQVAVPA